MTQKIIGLWLSYTRNLHIHEVLIYQSALTHFNKVWLLLGFSSNFESLDHEVNDMKNDSHHHQEQEVIWVSLNSSFQLAGSSFTVPLESLSYSKTNILFYSFDDISGVPISGVPIMTIDLHFWNSDIWNQIQWMILKQWPVSVLCRTSRVVPMPLLL